MTYVVTDSCIQCRHTKCVEICPVDAFHLGPNFIVIDPHECVDCGLCVPECPEEAIFPENRLDDGQRGFIALNAELSKCWPVIVQELEPLDGHADWTGCPDKLPFLRRKSA
jgi:ferredoxin